MAKAKYFDAIIAAQRHDASHPPSTPPPFDFGLLAPKGRWAGLMQRATERAIPILLRFARRWFPVFQLGGITWITRHADVVCALEDPATFQVPYGLEMRELSRGIAGEADFVLGVDGEAQSRQNQIIRRIVDDSDIDRIRAWSTAFASSLVDGGAGRLDVVGDFAIRVPTEICRRYFGLSFGDPGRFAEWAIAISAFLFADPTGDPVKRQLGLAGAYRLRRIIDSGIERAVERLQKGKLPKFCDQTLVERLVNLARTEPSLAIQHAEIRAIILGLVVGFIPTNGLAAAKMLELIFSRRKALAAARVAGMGQDSAAMRRIVLEAGRLNPALSPGQWRYAARDIEIGGKRIPAGSTVMVSTMSAMRDRRAYAEPNRFDPDAGNDAALVFGHATHRCLGERLATEVITAMMMPLFAVADLRRAKDRFGRMQRIGYFPERLDVEYRSAAAAQTMVLAVVPLAAANARAVADLLNRFGNPAHRAIRRRLDAMNIVHFASAVVVDSAEEGEVPAPHLIIELNVDGDRESAIRATAAQGRGWLKPLFRAALPGDSRPLADQFLDHCIDLHFRPWGATGLNFFGTGDFPVASIALQQRLRGRARSLLEDVMAENLDRRAMTFLGAVRRGLRADPRDAELDAFLVQPMRKEMALSRWRKPAHYWEPLRHVLAAGLGRRIAIAAAATIATFMVAIHFALSPESLSLGGLSDGFARLTGWFYQPRVAELVRAVAYGGFLFVIALVATTLMWGAVAGASYWLLRRTEDSEQPDDKAAAHDAIAAIAGLENAPGYRQNHITAVTALKPGLVRRCALALALWGIRQSLYWFRPGHVVTMGTIHYAKWFRLPGSNKMVFQSNYDGSWESYLEDFITRAHPGQTAAWSNGVGFPRTKGLIGEGARDGDRFKRWVRRQQVPTAFWYSRFPALTTDQIRTAALLHDGLARAQTDTAARAWLDLIGSAQRQPYELESAEIQSLVFRGLKGALYTACIPLVLPPNAIQRTAWLEALLEGRSEGKLTFGKFPNGNRALYLAFSPAGLARIGREGGAAKMPVPILDAFPGAFAMGMARRSRLLGDPAANAAPARLWSDGGDPGSPDVAEAVLIVYAPTAELLEKTITAQTDLLTRLEGVVVHTPIRTVTLNENGKPKEPGDKGPSHEHFGFRDGLTTPVIRGTEQFTPRRNSRDLVEPGEFILGYHNNQGYFAPAILVEAASDSSDALPIVAESVPFGFADFQDRQEQFAKRDFGRNGTFVVIRQLDQNVSAFEEYTKQQAASLNTRYGAEALREMVGDDVSPHWIGAKMMGRWQDGRPMVGNPTYFNQFGDEVPDNDFAYGRDDPRGHGCPLGAHVRRANPRDSLEPDDPLELMISNRHTMIRRGRAYYYDPTKNEYPIADPPADVECGLLFTALCADLERQFELVQQSWLAAPTFHGLDQESDPITAQAHGVENSQFTIPTPAGPIMLSGMPSFVSLRGGGYFFLPSRSAIDYLSNLGRDALVEQFLTT